MPRDASGNYTLPAGYLAVTGETIQASQHNPPLEDLAQSMSNSVPRNGTAPMSAPLKLADGTASAPGLAFASDPGTGLFKTPAGIGLAVGGVKTAELTFQLPIGLGPLPWSGASVPAGWVLCYGQTLSRAAYPDLWAFAQAEIAATNTLYNNGNGTTTFGIPDMRGRVAAGPDNMGGVAANRLPGFSVWALGGAASKALLRSDLPNVAPTFTGAPSTLSATFTATNNQVAVNFATGGTGNVASGGFATQSISGSVTGTTTAAGTIQDINGGVTQTAFSLVQPTAALNHILFAGA